ncbi:MAG: tRNA (adenosine(37)-N6)-threonylcarbamoyltransferase complex dimerization subunit type 1 TsaB [Sphingobacteriia bacterium]|nr:MAG: tRNA (adenosine(37)-N6)-threonylcarbamoyltransferase complex dimerization subunit type 1 TsaB [Sphingobacteriia bacterium]
MVRLIHLHTALESAWIGISQAGKIIWEDHHLEPQGHAGFLQSRLAVGLAEMGGDWSPYAAVSVSGGPGSYTGIRVGLASAKGLCYARQLPLIQLSTLAILAKAAALVTTEAVDGFLPLIDARRQEVFTALFNADGQEIRPAQALILDQENWLSEHQHQRLVAIGSGLKKWDPAAFSPHWKGLAEQALGPAQVSLAEQAHAQADYASLHLAEPFYAKAFYQPGKG